MNKKAIKNTAITRWSADDDCFIVSSPLLESVIGVGDSESEAQKEFCNILEDAHEAYLEGKLRYDNPGRPAKNRIALNVDVQTSTKNSIKNLAEEKGCSQGEVVDFLLASHLSSESFKSINSDAEFLIKESGASREYVTQTSTSRIEIQLKVVEQKLDRLLKSAEVSKKKQK